MKRIALLSMLMLPLALTACGSAGEGATCDPADAASCDEGLVCDRVGEEDLCVHPYGAECDADAEDPFCQGDASCIATDDGDRCFVAEGDACELGTEDQCDPDLRCAEVRGGDLASACFAPVVLAGTVSDVLTTEAIEDAQVIVLNAESVAVSDVATTPVDGAWALEVPAARDPEGHPLDTEIFTVRSDADGYQPFPGGLRSALPINAADAVETDGTLLVDVPPTQVGLLPLPAEEVGNRIQGQVLAGDDSGVLVVATVNGTTRTAVTDASGHYTLFDVPDGGVTVRGYKAGLQLAPAAVSMDGLDLADVDLEEVEEPTATVSGSVQMVNPGDGDATSVILVVADTFDEVSGRGETPPGLRAPRTGVPDVTGAWTIEGVPDGDYLVLAAFENDALVRDPDPGISGTDTLSLTVPHSVQGREIGLEGFKITGALSVFAPGADRVTTESTTPTFVWEDDSSEDGYSLVVYDSFGNVVWEVDDLPPVSGSSEVSVTYGEPQSGTVLVPSQPLEPGQYYQFRATSWRNSGPISATEDLRGVFMVQPVDTVE